MYLHNEGWSDHEVRRVSASWLRCLAKGAFIELG
jgi:hypothetical protein